MDARAKNVQSEREEERIEREKKKTCQMESSQSYDTRLTGVLLWLTEGGGEGGEGRCALHTQ